jgi:aryl-alcohol dehydrogenase-like predicted oxidoreductase
MIIATKLYGLVELAENAPQGSSPSLYQHRDYVNNYGLSRSAIFNATEGCLERLGTAYIDLLQIHRFDKNTPVEETMKALHDLVQSGKVRYIGASSMRCWQFGQFKPACVDLGFWVLTTL